jgi:hypothetical protein
MAFLSAGTPLALIAAVSLFSGVFRSVGLTGYTTLAFSDVPEEQMRDANTLQATNQQLASGLGVAAGAVLLRAGGALAEALAGNPGKAAAYEVAFLLLAAIALIPAARSLRLPPAAGERIRVRQGARGGSPAGPGSRSAAPPAASGPS